MIAYLFLLSLVTSLFSAEQKKGDPLEGITFFNGGNIGFIITGVTLGLEWSQQQTVRTKISSVTITDTNGVEGAAFTYSPEQRAVARRRQKSVIIGAFCVASTYLWNPSLSLMGQLRLRPNISCVNVMEQGLVPVMVGNTTQELLYNAFPTMPSEARDTLSALSAYFIPRGAVAFGVSPERMVMQAVMINLSGDLHNKYCLTPVLGQLTKSLHAATQRIPVMQTFGTVVLDKPGFYTLKTPYDFDKSVHFEKELYHTIMPTIIYAGLDCGIEGTLKAGKSTDTGKKIERAIDTQLEPIFGKEGTKDAKLVAKEALKMGATIVVFEVLKKVAKDGCTVM